MNTMSRKQHTRAFAFRAALFFAATSLALYIPYKYLTTLHALDGLYAVLFPLSGFLALAGISFAVKPMTCDCSLGIRSGIGGLSVLWGGAGMMCGGSLFSMILASPIAGTFATLQMLTQHVFLSAALLGFVIAPVWMLSKLGIEWSATPTSTETTNTPVSVPQSL